MEHPIFKINDRIDRIALAAEFARVGRVQVPNALAEQTASELTLMLQHQTNWGVAWQAGPQGPHYQDAAGVKAQLPDDLGTIQSATFRALRGTDYGFQFGSYPMLKAYLERWNSDGIHDYVFEHINDVPFMDLIRQVTGMPDLKKADAQATLYAPNHFLAQHDDSHVGQGWRVAYVLNLCPVEWRPDWGGYLNFFNDEGDIVAGWRPRFNTLNLFRVPQLHNVSFVPPFAPIARFAITGWFRDR
ncbi:2OG-Fe(II) oxygenase [Sphingorhabdus sp.]|uniref:2OG-Fe(II) oxygenase n=1 Tax=Sphingorhabdus sp. TaxID=1902408 RepID=UPI004047B631